MILKSTIVAAFLACLVASSAELVSKKVADRIRGAFYAALVADALCLGSHYEYDATKIKKAYGGNISKYMAPGEQMGGETHGIGWGSRNYHPGTVAGDQTDYGEYNILVLEHLAKTASEPHTFNVDEFLPTWKDRIVNNWKQWRCTQTKKALAMLQRGASSNQLGGPSNAMALRFAAAFAYYNSETDVVDAAKKSMFTHAERTARLGCEFFARVTFRIIHHGLKPREAIEQVASESDSWIKAKVKQAVEKVNEATDPSTPLSKEEFVDDLALTSMARLWDVGKSEPIKVGKASPTEGTLPGAVYFILKYEDSFEMAAKANAMVGGDNASRSIAVGMVMGAYHGVEAISKNLRDGLNNWHHCQDLLDSLPLLSRASIDHEL